MSHKIGYIGFGEMASGYHYQVAADRPDVPGIAPAAVCEVRQSQRDLAVSRGLTAYDNLDDFLASDVDIVVVATPNNLHREMACRAFAAGKHVICEKPVTLSPEDFQVMIDASKAAGKLLCVHQNRRTDRDFLIVKQVIADGRIGKPYMINSHVGGSGGGAMWGWRGFKDQGGGMLLDWGVHLLDQVLWLIDEPIKSVYAIVRNIKSDEVDDYSKIIITFQSGLAAEVEVATYDQIHSPRWMVYGDRGALKVDKINDGEATLKAAFSADIERVTALAYDGGAPIERTLRENDEDIRTVTYPDDGKVFKQDWVDLYKNIIAAIDGKEELIVKPEQVMRVLRVIQAAFRSSETGEAVMF